MAKRKTEEALKTALAGREVPLTDAAVEEMRLTAGCSTATFYRSAAYHVFKARLDGPKPKATKGTKNTMTTLRATVTRLANIVQGLSLRLEEQEKELTTLRAQASANVVALNGRLERDVRMAAGPPPA